MAVICTAGIEDGKMGAKKIKDTRRRLSGQYDNLINSINRKRNAAEDIRLEKTKDESDLATISHDRDLLYTLHESDFLRLRFIEHAMKAIDRGQYGKCVRCGEDINDKRLEAVPWAKMCIGCQKETEAEYISPAVMASLEPEVPKW
jgi:DnaK suppressor protein